MLRRVITCSKLSLNFSPLSKSSIEKLSSNDFEAGGYKCFQLLSKVDLGSEGLFCREERELAMDKDKGQLMGDKKVTTKKTDIKLRKANGRGVNSLAGKAVFNGPADTKGLVFGLTRKAVFEGVVSTGKAGIEAGGIESKKRSKKVSKSIDRVQNFLKNSKAEGIRKNGEVLDKGETSLAKSVGKDGVVFDICVASPTGCLDRIDIEKSDSVGSSDSNVIASGGRGFISKFSVTGKSKNINIKPPFRKSEGEAQEMFQLYLCLTSLE
ncbi:hypothetical protein Q3G72_009827 [Acer saccharum]|nr:hypothetical protein Q3G72_009827 [Acer saccharum]